MTRPDDTGRIPLRSVLDPEPQRDSFVPMLAGYGALIAVTGVVVALLVATAIDEIVSLATGAP